MFRNPISYQSICPANAEVAYLILRKACLIPVLDPIHFPTLVSTLEYLPFPFRKQDPDQRMLPACQLFSGGATAPSENLQTEKHLLLSP
jgi:hypothetical protein